MPIESVPGTGLTYHLISYDEEGRERQDDPDGLMSRNAAKALADPAVTDVFLLSHGWIGDVPKARTQYSRWIGAMAANSDDLARMRAKRPGFRPLLIGLHWPSEPWGDESLSNTSSFAVAGDDPGAELIDAIAARTADTSAARASLRTIVTAASENSNPPHLPPEVLAAYAVLDHETGLGQEGAGAAPGRDREPFNAESVYQESQSAGVSFGGFADGLLAPLRALSFWVMKDRARLFGETGAHQLLRDLIVQANSRGVRFHLMGHSFGCIVVSAAVAGPAGSRLPTPIDSLSLIQGALSLWSYCSDIPSVPGTSGYFQRLVSERRVLGPIITTQSTFDRAVGTWYPWAAGVRGQVSFAPGELPKYGAAGAFGVRGPGVEADDRLVLQTGHAYRFEPGKIYNIDCSEVINIGGGFGGAHNDIAKPEVAHAVWEAAMT